MLMPAGGVQAELSAAQADGEKVIGLQQQLVQSQDQAAQLRTRLAAAEQEAAAEAADLRRELSQVSASRLHMLGGNSQQQDS